MTFISSPSARRALCALVAAGMLLEPVSATAALLQLVKIPLFISGPIPPLVMLDISKDQQLFKKAYNDYSDLDGDGVLERTYKHSIDYYGYFDSYKCYAYGDTTLSGKFSTTTKPVTPTPHFYPTRFTTDKLCGGSGEWSGNFINWVAMSRADAVRKLLFGGARVVDVPSMANNIPAYGSNTILERAYIPTDAHSWSKFYLPKAAGDPAINMLTPFSPPTTNPSSGQVTINSPAAAKCPGAIASNAGQNGTATAISFCNLTATFVQQVALGDQMQAVSANGITMKGRVTDLGSSSGGYVTIKVQGGTIGSTLPNSATWTLTNLTVAGITICNTSLADGTNTLSQNMVNNPLMRVVQGNFELWNASEVWQCRLREEKSALQSGFAGDNATSNGNQAALSGLNASAENPAKASYTLNGIATPARGLGLTDYSVRVEVCNSAYVTPPSGQKTTEKCKAYNQLGDFKPTGLLQTYAEDGKILFGLMTGSYNNNISGGVLRKNVSDLSTEISADGVFITDPLNGTIIKNLSRMRMYGYDASSGLYNTADNCPYQFTSSDLKNGICRSWGNPMSEIYAESLRYFAGATTPSSNFNTDDSTLFTQKIRTAPWPTTSTQVISNNNYCSPLNILVFNASVSSKDSDEVVNPFTGVTGTPKELTDKVGAAENLTTGSYFIGNNGVTSDNLCDAKPFGTGGGTLGSAQGLCPEAPSLNGSYLMAGLAYAARTNRIRNDLTAVPATDTKSLKVATYGISLATNVPRIELTTPTTKKKVVLQPSYRLVNGSGKIGAGAIVDVKVVDYVPPIDATTGNPVPCDTAAGEQCGSLYVNWEDSEQGGDYDQDMWGIISYVLTDTKFKVTTKVVAASTANPQGFGYIVSGTTADGPHFHSGIYNAQFTDPNPVTVVDASTGVVLNSALSSSKINASGGCNGNCSPGSGGTGGVISTFDPATSVNYTLAASSTIGSLQDPLWYAAKYGGFVDADSNGLPNLSTEWDNFNNITGAMGSDGMPDNFFFVTNPLGLELALDKLFISILQSAAASAVAANSSKLNTSTRVYQAVFNPLDWSGKLLAYGVDPNTGTPNTTPDWDAGQVDLNAATVSPSTRKLITFNKGVSGAAPVGIPFTWPTDPANPLATELSPVQITALRTNPDTLVLDPLPSPYVTTSDLGYMRLQYLRGDGSNEGLAATNFRRRLTSKLGDIIDSNPRFVAAPAGGYPDASYRSFASTYQNRKPVLYVGANDGMLHAFNACTPSTDTTRPAQCGSGNTTLGGELLGYIPSPVYRNLSKLTSRSYSQNTHEMMVDGSPAVEDAEVGGAGKWKSVLVGGLGRGGQGVFALDVTDPENFSQAKAKELVMWEFTDADDPDLGFTFGTPAIRKMQNGKWAAIVSGGYNNTQGSSTDAAEKTCGTVDGVTTAYASPPGCTVSGNGYGWIFILNLEGPTGTNGTWQLGTDYIKVRSTNGNVGTPGGFGSPLAADIDGDGLADYIYAGDLNGSLWRFDVTSKTPSVWAADTSRLLLFNAVNGNGVAQPITAGVEAVRHPSGEGVMVSFGTGKYLEKSDVATDPTTYQTQSLYGIWDRGAGVTGGPWNTKTPVSNSRTDGGELMQQNLQPGITNVVTNPDGSVSRITTRHQPNYGTTATANPKWDGSPSNIDKLYATSNYSTDTVPSQRGWYFDLFNGPAPTYPQGERIIYTPFVKNGIVFYASLWPIGNTCLGTTAGDFITLDIATGARPDASVFDISGDRLVNTSDLAPTGLTDGNGKAIMIAVSSRRIDSGSSQPPTLVAKGNQDIGYVNPTSGKLGTLDLKFGRGSGRVSWREILY